MTHEKTDAIQYAAAIGQATSTDLMILCREMEGQNNALLQACQNALMALEAQDNIHALPIAICDAMQEMRGVIAMAKG